MKDYKCLKGITCLFLLAMKDWWSVGDPVGKNGKSKQLLLSAPHPSRLFRIRIRRQVCKNSSQEEEWSFIKGKEGEEERF